MRSPGAATLAVHPGRLSEYVAYLGYPLLVLLIVAAVVWWRDPRVRVAALAGAVLEILSLGGTQVIRGVTIPPVLLPWHWLAHLPVLSQMLPDRLSILADGLAAVVLAVSLDLALSAAQQPRWRRQGLPLALAARRQHRWSALLSRWSWPLIAVRAGCYAPPDRLWE